MRLLVRFCFVGKHQCFKSDAGAMDSQWRECSNGMVRSILVSLAKVECCSKANLPGMSYNSKVLRLQGTQQGPGWPVYKETDESF